VKAQRRKISVETVWTGTQLDANERYEHLRLAGTELTNQRANGVLFREVDCAGLRLAGSELKHSSWFDVHIEGSDLANIRWDRAQLRDVNVSSSRLVGLVAAEATIEDTVFEECDLTLTQWRFSHLKRVRFERCTLTEADFVGADLTGAVFHDCEMESVDMSQAKAAGLDLRGSRIEGLRISPLQMKGGFVDFDQGVYLLSAIGLNVG